MKYCKTTDKVRRFIKQHNLLSQKSKILLSVSGGKDSVTLLHIMSKIRKDFDFEIAVAHVNHKLRKKESDQDADFVKKLSKSYKLKFYLKTIQQKEYTKYQNHSPEERARILRYEKLNEILKEAGCDLIALGHTKTDSAENTMLRFIKGSGPIGLSGIKPRSNILIRPLLCLDQNEISDYINTNKLSFVEDSSNKNLNYERNFIRNFIFPEITKKMNMNLCQTLNELSTIQSWVSDNLNGQITKIENKLVINSRDGVKIDLKNLASESKIIQFLFLRKIYKKISTEEISNRTLFNILDVISNSKPTLGLNLPKKFILTKRYNFLNIIKKKDTIQHEVVIDKIPITIEWENFKIIIDKIGVKEITDLKDSSGKYYLDYKKLSFPLKVRNFKQGDTFWRLGSAGKKKVNRFFIDKKIPREERGSVPLLLSDDKVAMICGYGLSELFKIDNKTNEVLEVKVKW